MFIDSLKKMFDGMKINYTHFHGDVAWENSKNMYEDLFHQTTKRILFDSKQSSIFLDISEEMPDYKTQIKLPFDKFYIEFTENIPLMIDLPFQGGLRRMRGFYLEREKEKNNLAKIVVFIDGGSPADIIHLNWIINITEKEVFDLENLQKRDGKENLESAVKLTKFITWILLYLMCKSINIEEEELSRQQRRFNERHPNSLSNLQPWHKVKIEPKYYKKTSPTGEGGKHSIRYDVIGHVRIGRHKLKDGTYVEHLEWIEAHQRGLSNDIYIPKLYVAEGTKVADSGTMKKFFERK